MGIRDQINGITEQKVQEVLDETIEEMQRWENSPKRHFRIYLSEKALANFNNVIKKYLNEHYEK